MYGRREAFLADVEFKQKKLGWTRLMVSLIGQVSLLLQESIPQLLSAALSTSNHNTDKDG